MLLSYMINQQMHISKHVSSHIISYKCEVLVYNRSKQHLFNARTWNTQRYGWTFTHL